MAESGGAQEGAVFIQHATADGGGRVNAVQGADQYVYIYRGPPPYRVEPFPLAPPVASTRLTRVPSRLLTARHRVVPYFPRPELGTLETWRDQETPAFSVRLVYAEGGAGKTRLAYRFAESSAAAGWTTALARHRSETASAGGADVSLAVRAPGLVLIVDYADRWPSEDLITLVRQHRDAARDRVRLLLLSRSAGNWWQSVAHQFWQLDIDDAQPLKLEALPVDPSVRAAVYTAARDRFAEVFALPGPARPGLPERLGDPEFALTLTVHMRALIDVDAAGRGTAAPSGNGQAALSSYLLDREHDHWRSSHDQGYGPVRTDERTMGRTVYVATLTQAQTPTDAAAALVRAAVADTTALGAQLAEDHARYYPPADPDLVLDPLSPDRLGEDYLALTVPGHEDEFGYYATDPWTSTAPQLLLAPDGADQATAKPPPYAGPALTVLVEAAHRWPHLIDRHLSPLLLRNPKLALTAGGATLTRLADLSGLAPAVLEAVEARLPERRHVDLDPGIAAVTARLTEYRAGRTTDPTELADMYITLGRRYENAGQLREAADVSKRAVAALSTRARVRAFCPPALAESPPADLPRRPAWPGQPRRTSGVGGRAAGLRGIGLRGKSKAALPFLAVAMTNLGGQLSEFGMRQEALVWTEHAVALLQMLAKRDPDTYRSRLAKALNNLGNQLSNLGRRQEALAPAGQAVDIYRRLADQSPDEFQPEYASTLNSLGSLRLQIGAAQEALDTIGQAVELFRTLAEQYPDTYLPKLAMVLNNLGNQLSELGRRQEAVALAEHVAQVYGRLADQNPAAFLADHAMALGNLGIQCARIGRFRQALPPTERAVELYRELAEQNPTRHRPDLARALDRLGGRLSDLGRPEEALALSEQAADMYRELAEHYPDVYLPDYAMVLNNVGNELVEVGRPVRAVAAIEHSAQLFRTLADQSPDVYLPKLAAVLNNLGMHLPRAGRLQDALAPAEQAVELRRTLAESNPAAHLPGLARALNTLANRLADVGRVQEALTTIEQTVDIYRDLTKQNPDGYSSDHATALNILGECLYKLGRSQESLAAFKHAAQLLQPLAEQNPGLYSSAYATALNNVGTTSSESGRPQEALLSFEHAVDVLRPLAERNPDRHGPGLAGALKHLAIELSEAGRWQEALAPTGQAVDIYRALADRDPTAHLPEFAHALWRFALIRADCARELEQALAAIEEAVETYRSLAEQLPEPFAAHLRGATQTRTDVLDALGSSIRPRT